MLFYHQILELKNKSKLPVIYGNILRYKDLYKLDVNEKIKNALHITYKDASEKLKILLFSLIMTEYLPAEMNNNLAYKIYKTTVPWSALYYYHMSLLDLLFNGDIKETIKFMQKNEDEVIRKLLNSTSWIAKFMNYRKNYLVREITSKEYFANLFNPNLVSSYEVLRMMDSPYFRRNLLNSLTKTLKYYNRLFTNDKYELLIKIIKLLGIQVIKFEITNFDYSEYGAVFNGIEHKYIFHPENRTICIPPTLIVKAVSNMNKKEIVNTKESERNVKFILMFRRILKDILELYEYVNKDYNKYYKLFFVDERLWHKFNEDINFYNWRGIHYYGLGNGIINLLIIDETNVEMDNEFTEMVNKTKKKLVEAGIWKEDNIETIKNIIDEVLKGNRKVIKAIRDIGIACTYDTMPKILADECLKDK